MARKHKKDLDESQVLDVSQIEQISSNIGIPTRAEPIIDQSQCKDPPDEPIVLDELDVICSSEVPSDTEIPAHNPIGIETQRSLCANQPENALILEKLKALYNSVTPGECSPDLFDKYAIDSIDNLEDLRRYLSELLIRFDTSPRNYTKQDYLFLLGLLCKSFVYIYNPDNMLSWIGEEPPEHNRVSFMKVSGSLQAFENAILQHPKSVIFYQGRNSINQTVYKIYANGFVYDISSREDYTELKHQIEILNGDVHTEGSVEYKIQQALQEYHIRDVDTNPINGAKLTLNNGVLGLHLDLVNYETNGAMASNDKIKLDNLDWITISNNQDNNN